MALDCFSMKVERPAGLFGVRLRDDGLHQVPEAEQASGGSVDRLRVHKPGLDGPESQQAVTFARDNRHVARAESVDALGIPGGGVLLDWERRRGGSHDCTAGW
jgi:hypothetical protein